jgi:hypothetical protein
LEQLVRSPVHSRNPNVLRIEAVKALTSCGDAESIEVIQPFTKGSYFNALTATAINALSAITERHPETLDRTRAILVDAYPVPASKADQHQSRYCVSLAKTVHGALRKVDKREIAFPEEYTSDTRSQLVKSWQK